MPGWHQIMFQFIPVLSLIAVFFLSIRSRLDRIEVRMDHIEKRSMDSFRVLDRKQDSSGCVELHKAIHSRLDQLTEDVRGLLAHVIDLSKFVKTNGNGGK
jgi:hypothetical protein